MRIKAGLPTLLLTLALSAAVAAIADAVVLPATAWAPLAASGPTNLAPGSEGTISLYVENVGGKTSEGAISFEDTLPPGILTTATPFDPSHTAPLSCSPGAGQSTITCTSTEEVGPGSTPNPIDIPVVVEPGALTGQNVFTVSGGGAIDPATYEAPITIDTTPAKAGVDAYFAGTFDADGTPSALAASHPYSADVGVLVNTVRTVDGKAVVPAGDPKTIAVDLPPGFFGNPTTTERCTEGLRDSQCPLNSQVGLSFPVATNFGAAAQGSAVHSTETPIGYPGKFTFSIVGDLYQANLLASLRSDEDYGITVTAPNIAQIVPVYGSFASVWGTPASPSHDEQRCIIVPGQGNAGTGCGPSTEEREKPLLTMASDCALEAVQPPVVTAAFDSWQHPGEFDHEVFPVPAVEECGGLTLSGAAFSLTPDSTSAATPSSFEVALTLPQEGLLDPEALATPPLKHGVFTFPVGVSLNEAAAGTLATCSEAQIGFEEFGPEPNRTRFNKKPATCPDASKVGTLEVQTALLDEPLHGSLYLAAQGDNPFGSLLAVYLVIEDPRTGIVIKLPGEMRSDPATGQLSTVFEDLPQLPVGLTRVKIKGGDRAPLATPDTCGQFATHTQLAPWSFPEAPETQTTSSFAVNAPTPGAPSCPTAAAGRPFSPTLSAGSASTSAGAFSPFELKVTRKDGEQQLRGVSFTLPDGLTGKLAGIATCTEAQIAAAQTRSGKAEQANPSCPASSQLGSVDTTAGIGGSPIHVGGHLYLAPPYKGAPLSVVAIVPAVAGPYDLGTVISRTPTYIDPVTGRLTATTDPLPTQLKNIPVHLRSLKVDVDRPGFILNPTGCEKTSISATVTGESASSTSTVPFQVGGCQNLAFKPKFKATLKGGTARNAHPAFSASLDYPPGPGYANIAFAQVALPHSEFLDQSHINTVCTRAQFSANACPPGSVYGHAEATTPLLDETLEGPVYLRSSDNKLPDLVIALKGPPSRPVEVDVDGRIDSIHGGIRTTVQSVPDLPVSHFEISMKGGNKGLLVNSRDLCKGRKARMTVRLIAHNGKRADQFPVLGNGCGKHSRHR